MLLATSLSLFLGLGSSLVAATPLFSRANSTGPVRVCGTNPTQQFMDQAEAHFAKNKVVSVAGAAVASIPIYCTVYFLVVPSSW